MENEDKSENSWRSLFESREFRETLALSVMIVSSVVPSIVPRCSLTIEGEEMVEWAKTVLDKKEDAAHG